MAKDVYVDLDGKEISLKYLDREEKALVAKLIAHARAHRPSVPPEDWNEFDNFSLREIDKVYDARGVSRRAATQTAVFVIAQDLSSRLAIASGMAREPDYRDELEEIIRTRFRSRRAFCKKSGLSEDMLSHVLAGRKHLSMQTFTEALSRIGCRVRITPRITSRVQKKKTG